MVWNKRILFFIIASVNDISDVQGNMYELYTNGTHYFMVNADDVNLFGGNITAINTEVSK